MAFKFTKEVLDPQTGEVIKAIAVIPEPKDRDRDFVKIYKLFSEKLLQDLNSLNGEVKLLFWLVAKTLELPIQSDLWIPVKYGEVARELGTNERTIRRYLKKLLDKEYIEQFNRRHPVFRIKPEFLYKGNLAKYKSDEMDKVLREREIEEEREREEEQED